MMTRSAYFPRDKDPYSFDKPRADAALRVAAISDSGIVILSNTHAKCITVGYKVQIYYKFTDFSLTNVIYIACNYIGKLSKHAKFLFFSQRSFID